jgi:general secretion pathway protein G
MMVEMRRSNMKRGNRRTGFTLMEMMLVLGIIALLVGVGVPMMTGVFADAEKGRVKADFRTIDTALIRYRTRARMFPTTEQGLDALVNRPTLAPQPEVWERVLKPEGIVDPWRNRYQYVYPGKRNPDDYDLISFGPDGKPGTADDMGNW